MTRSAARSNRGPGSPARTGGTVLAYRSDMYSRGMRLTLLLGALALVACDGGGGDGPLRPDAGPGTGSGRRDVGEATLVEGGPTSGELCGALRVVGDLEVPEGETLTICAGSTVALEGVSITVAGTLRLAGTADAPVQLNGDRRWGGIAVRGALEADFAEIYDAEDGVRGEAGSSIRLDDSLLYARGLSNLRLANGAVLHRTRVFGGGTVRVSGGVLSMVDAELDLDHPGESPDCTAVSGGTLEIDHSRLTNCHCPIHINAADAPVSVTNSVLDGAAYPVMIARASGVFRGNVLEGSRAHFQDIGGEIDVDVAGNFYLGDAMRLDTDAPGQFRGADDALIERPADAGPR